ncbi:hypothetical protein [Hymenobacter sp.]|uniref:hypothetical protein n=1 Tax=Hymenobacter sp. TaxID=1898978 RepID=UPI00286ABFF4|nr:hypothetical protein [Hymenobacter sp.]
MTALCCLGRGLAARAAGGCRFGRLAARRVTLATLLGGLAQGATAQASASAPLSVFLLGGTGHAAPGPALAAGPALLDQARAAGPGSVLVVLGDYLPASGLPTAQEPGRAAAELVLRPLLRTLREFPGRVVVVPGGAEWQNGGPRGWARVREQEAYIRAAVPGAILAPAGGCPGPTEIALDATHALVVLDTQWWLHAWDKPAEESACDARDPAAVVVQLDDVLGRNQDKHILVAGHHPLHSAGYRFWKAALPNPRNRLLRRSLLGVLDRFPHLTYAGGHETSLQYLEPAPGRHYVVSGAGATAGGRTPRRSALFATRTVGFGRLDYSTADSVMLTLRSANGQVLYRQGWVEPTAALRPLPTANTDDRGPDSAVVKAGEQYRAGRLKTWLLGQNYRAEWAQPVRVPVLDLGRAHGGLVPVKRGGGLQTKSLRLRAPDGREYVLRSVSKEVDRAVPPFLRRTLAADVVQDQISASHPYAALTVPVLAEAAGVPHTRPQIVLVPDDSRLGPYRRAFAGTLAVLETRDPFSPAAFRGAPQPKAYSTQDVLDQLRADPRHRVDQRQVLRARLLDLLLADWDRHDDQWRWLAYRLPNGGRLFRAAPRDRDQAYFVNQGFLPRQVSTDWTLPKFQGFAYDFRNVRTFNFQARHFDRSFLTALSQADWLAIADSVRASLPDSVLARAVSRLPGAVRQLSGPTILAKLKAHRDRLPEWAREYYHFLAREVDVVGSNQAETFTVERLGPDRTRVTVFALADPGQRGPALYQRVFRTDETREVRLFGQGGADVFRLLGTEGWGEMRVRIIGGAGADSVTNGPSDRHHGRKTLVYDEPGGVQLAAGLNARALTSSAAGGNAYNRTGFRYDYTGPLYPLAFNLDDGVFVGVGVLARRPGFRKEPWAATHRLTGNVALATGAFSFAYQAQLTHVLGPLDLVLAADVQAPNYVRNFFGLGNDTPYDARENIRDYRVRFRHLGAEAQVQRRLDDHWQLGAGPAYQAVDVENTANRFLARVTDPRVRPAELFELKQYGGATARVAYDRRADPLLLPHGLTWRTDFTAFRALNAAARPLTLLSSELALYRSLHFPLRLTLATRFGGAAVLSRDFEFFQAATLDGLANLRGYRRTRFAGRQRAYNNAEVRVQVGQFRSYLFPATYGLLAFHDVGRVWVPAETSRTWHRGYGGGIWLAPFQQVVLSAMLGFSREDTLPMARLGFFF